MKSLNSKLFALAATLAIAATASAQVSLKATVPFSFEVASHQVLPAGSYRVYRSGNIWTFTNEGTRNKAMAIAPVRMESNRTDQPRMTFECRSNGCALRNIQTGGGELGGYFPAPKHSKSDANELARLVMVPLSPAAE